MDTNNAEFDDTIREMLAVTAPVIEEVTVGGEEETSNTAAVLESPIPENNSTASDFSVFVTEPLVEEETVEDEEERSNTTAGLVEPLIEDEEETSNTTLALESSIPEDSTTVSVPNAPVALVSENMNDTSSSNFISISSTLSLL